MSALPAAHVPGERDAAWQEDGDRGGGYRPIW